MTMAECDDGNPGNLERFGEKSSFGGRPVALVVSDDAISPLLRPSRLSYPPTTSHVMYRYRNRYETHDIGNVAKFQDLERIGEKSIWEHP